MKITALKKYILSILFLVLSIIFTLQIIFAYTPYNVAVNALTETKNTNKNKNNTDEPLVLKICNWEEYIDEGDWDIDEVIDLESGDIFGENSLIYEFEDWYKETYGIEVNVEYSNFGTNEDLYNMLTLGDSFDLICPSEYMFMKLMSEDALLPLSDEFFNRNNEYNYYIRGVSPYLEDIFDSHEINGERWSKYAAGYMWGITGFLYNPEYVTEQEASTWQLITNPKFERLVTIKDNVRDSYFAAVGAINSELLESESFINNTDYKQNLENIMNDTSPAEIERVQDYLQTAKDNVYAFETDSGKADMITGKVVANYQWSGDAVYSMDQAEQDNVKLNFSVPKESTNIYFDGWVMLKNGIQGNSQKQHAAEAFINFISRPDNAIRNMNYIGYTSFISGGEDSRIFEYLKWNYAAENESIKTVDYDINYFFTGNMENSESQYILTVDAGQIGRQLTAQYPSPEIMQRSAVMRYFTPEQYTDINSMWINVRCYNLKKMPIWGWIITVIVIVLFIWISIHKIIQIRKNNNN